MTPTLIILLGFTIFFLAIMIFGIFWAIKHNQFEDMEGPAQRILMDDSDPLMPKQPKEEKSIPPK